MAKKEKTNQKAQENWSHKNDFPIVEIWNTYQALAELIAPRLRTFKAHDKHGYCPDFKGMAEWNQAIQQMIDAFELIIDEDNRIFTDEEEQTIDHGLELFGKYFRYLWD